MRARYSKQECKQQQCCILLLLTHREDRMYQLALEVDRYIYIVLLTDHDVALCTREDRDFHEYLSSLQNSRLA